MNVMVSSAELHFDCFFQGCPTWPQMPHIHPDPSEIVIFWVNWVIWLCGAEVAKWVSLELGLRALAVDDDLKAENE